MPNDTPSFKEDHISQIPALQLLINLGYEYITPAEAMRLRGGKAGNVILETVLEDRLKNMPCNTFTSGGKEYQFSNSSVSEAINTLKKMPYDGLIRNNEQIYDLLSLGKIFEETLPSGKKSFDLKYIDWENISDNIYHVTEEFSVETSDGVHHRRPDIVLFINGIPVCVIECKRPDMKKPVEQAISQQLRNQAREEIYYLFTFSQILIALSVDDASYGTTGTPIKFWSKWKERSNDAADIQALINKPLNSDVKTGIFKERYQYALKYFEDMESMGRQVTEQDRVIYRLCRHERLMDLIRYFIIFDAGEKKIARHQQFFVVKSAVERVKQYETKSKRKGGVIWHTQGSGKSLTMVMLSKAIAMESSISNPRVIIVTDRINLDKQIRDTFRHCGIDAKRAGSGTDLLKLLENEQNTVMTTVLFKFRSAVRKSDKEINTENVFVLADEGHRSHYGTARGTMERMLPGACYIGFTGTPLMKDEKRSTIEKFGGFIDPTYTIEEATEDGAVVRLIYEGRMNILNVNQEETDKWFVRESEGLSYGQQADLKREYTRKSRLMSVEDNIKAIAYDISEHYSKNWKDTGFKAQLATGSKADALKYKKYLDSFGKVTSEVLISGPDDREGYEDVDEEPNDEVKKFWKKMMERFGDSEKYEEQIVNMFKHGDEPEIIIVVSKLLTGFDAPRNAILYLAKELHDHTLLQAIARVNRVCEGKEYGFIVDYAGILGELDKALTFYKALGRFEESDLKGALISMKEEVKQVSEDYTNLKAMFRSIKNKQDSEEYLRVLNDEEIRDKFYERISRFSLRMGIVLSSGIFYEEVDEKQIEEYKRHLKFFQNLRRMSKNRYAEKLDMAEYEPKIKRILDTYITSGDMVQLTGQVDIFDSVKFEKAVEQVEGKAAKADTIAYNTQRTIKEKFDEDPVFFKKFSELLKDAIEAFKAERISDAQYLDKVKDIAQSVVNKDSEGLPEEIKGNGAVAAIYRVVEDGLKDSEKAGGIDMSKTAFMIEDIVNRHAIVDWQENEDAKKSMLNSLEDYMIDELGVDYNSVDVISTEIMKIALSRYTK
ncbi:MAG TPA: type I restriction endonuclease subunit R [bacterium]|nr:type I restriction endonuclease subunit R [bacterium]